ncbi:MAG: hypothetical protein K8F27_04425 [Sulfuricellaceae bacterium]|nr:hypothetical protein [Sulfuricellaceae bacterium]
MKCSVSIETAVLKWLGRFSVGLAALGLPASLIDPILLPVSFLALILGGFSAVAGKLYYVAIDAGIVAVSILIALMSFTHVPSETPLSSVFILGLLMFLPPYLIAAALAAFGRWRARRSGSLAPPSSDGSFL